MQNKQLAFLIQTFQFVCHFVLIAALSMIVNGGTFARDIQLLRVGTVLLRRFGILAELPISIRDRPRSSYIIIGTILAARETSILLHALKPVLQFATRLPSHFATCFDTKNCGTISTSVYFSQRCSLRSRRSRACGGKVQRCGTKCNMVFTIFVAILWNV